METFQLVVLMIATVTLIIVFTAIGITLKYYSHTGGYPPVETTCPEYWTVNPNGDCVIPVNNGVNAGKLYTDNGVIYLTNDPVDNSGKIYTPGYDSANGVIRFENSLWTIDGRSAICSKQAWANKNAVVWDGVSNYNSCE
jgi:hypothetical protein